jgi:2'-5' RNA ligase
MMRLFVAAWPPPSVMERLEGLARPSHAGLRWTTAQQWHVTLRFLGAVEEDRFVDALGCLEASATHSAAPVVARSGPRTRTLGPGLLCLPVLGLEPLADRVATAFASVGTARDGRPFVGHLTLARARRGVRIPAALTGIAFEASWDVTEIALVESQLHSSGARYRTVARAPLAP